MKYLQQCNCGRTTGKDGVLRDGQCPTYVWENDDGGLIRLTRAGHQAAAYRLGWQAWGGRQPDGIWDTGVSWEVLAAGLKNLGVDADCGACMEVFFTGATTGGHSHPVEVPTMTVEVGPDRSGCQPWCGQHWREALATIERQAAAGENRLGGDGTYLSGHPNGLSEDRRFCSTACREAEVPAL